MAINFSRLSRLSFHLFLTYPVLTFYHVIVLDTLLVK
jgi:hypothetical protein